MWIDLSGKVYARELMREAGVSSSAYYHWEKFSKLTSVGTHKFISKEDLETLPKYWDAFERCFKWDGYLPLSYLTGTVFPHSTWLNEAEKYGRLKLDKIKSGKLIGVKLPEEIKDLMKDGKAIVAIGARLRDEQLYDGIIKIQRVYFGYY